MLNLLYFIIRVAPVQFELTYSDLSDRWSELRVQSEGKSKGQRVGLLCAKIAATKEINNSSPTD